MSESTYLQPLLRNRENWKSGNILVLLNPSQKNNLMVIFFSIFLSRLRDPKMCSVSSLYGDQAITGLLKSCKGWGNVYGILNFEFKNSNVHGSL